jgi:hypothetical protein
MGTRYIYTHIPEKWFSVFKSHRTPWFYSVSAKELLLFQGALREVNGTSPKTDSKHPAALVAILWVILMASSKLPPLESSEMMDKTPSYPNKTPRPPFPKEATGCGGLRTWPCGCDNSSPCQTSWQLVFWNMPAPAVIILNISRAQWPNSLSVLTRYQNLPLVQCRTYCQKPEPLNFTLLL